MTTTEHTTNTNGHNGDLQRALGDLVGVATLWARHGLGVARSALDAGATTLSRTGQVLQTLSDRLDRPAPTPAEEPPPAA